jgi:dolichyl-phosphate-mannose--protein O-mannosyl transferase
MLLLSLLLTSSCSPIPSPPLLLTFLTCFGAISSVFVIISYMAHAAHCELWRKQWHSSRSPGPCCGGRWAAVFASGFILLKFIVEKECVRERSNHTLLPVYGCLCWHACVYAIIHSFACLLLGSYRARRGAEKVPKSRVALRTIFRIAVVAWTSHTGGPRERTCMCNV